MASCIMKAFMNVVSALSSEHRGHFRVSNVLHALEPRFRNNHTCRFQENSMHTRVSISICVVVTGEQHVRSAANNDVTGKTKVGWLDRIRSRMCICLVESE